MYWLDTLTQDTRFAFRLIARNRWISLTIVATLTVGIALNVTVFSVLNAVLLRPWVRSDPATFVSVIPRFSGKYDLRFSEYGSMSQPDYLRYRDSATSLAALAAYRLLPLTVSGEESGSVPGGLMSCNLFDVIRPGPPLLGRYLAPDECTTPMQPAVAVLSETAWRVRFNADARVVGRQVHLNRIPFTIVGVAPSFPLSGAGGGPARAADVWIPYTMLGSVRPADEYFGDARAQWLTVLGRRNPGYSLQQVEQELNGLARHADEQLAGRVTRLIVTDGSLISDPEMRARAPILFSASLGTMTLLLLLACVNVTTLLLSRSAARQREIAVRLSLGAGRVRLLRQFLTESLALSGLAAALSVLIAQYAPGALWSALTSSTVPFDLTPDWRVLLYCVGIAAGAGVIAGLSPAVESLRPKLAESLKGSSTATTAGHRRSRLRGVLVAVQIALSLVLVVQVTLFARAQRRFFSYDPGFETKQVLSVTLGSVVAGFEPPATFYDELQSRVSGLPGVLHASYASLVPWSGRNPTRLAEIDGQPVPPTTDFRQDPTRRLVTPEYFPALGISLTRGRLFTRADTSSPLTVPAVISEAMARRYWPNQDPLGHRFRAGVVLEVIGVCRDVQSLSFMRDDGPFYYAPLDTKERKPAFMLVRVAGDTQAAASALGGLVRQIDPQMASTVVTLASVVERQGEEMKPLMMFGAFAGLLALFLALTGVYAVVSFSMSQRVREIGIRMALGAQRKDVISLVMRSGIVPVAGGLIVGIGLTLAISTGMESLVAQSSTRDPVLLTVVPLLLFVAALGAIWIPARRAVAVDPLASLRDE
jgi:predicted permease